ncbi:hypothetical protein [Helicobacter sp. MIT 01-3238]|uniref:hypothetical protein n=1 Tax=Helicobacter sp. MIT 01-3238 TaxID=398627 RepID=UPI000E1FA527|nr:hypothetical protein [Helicobacter sp. MIT 01-3238]RDU53504.1 hypothetical protein CQA40_05130 [Helicobacter sp. MIT 01-3238]
MKHTPKSTQKLLRLSLCAFALCISANATNAQNPQATQTTQATHEKSHKNTQAINEAQNSLDSRDSSHDLHSRASNDDSSSHAHDLSDSHKPHDSNDLSHSHDSHSLDNSQDSHSNHDNHAHPASHFTSRYHYLHAYELHEHGHSRTSDFASLSARVGIFGKSSALASKAENSNRDNYAMLYSSVLLQSTPFARSHTALNGLTLGVGVVAYAPFYTDKANAYTYINSNFVANNAYLGYIKDFDRLSLEVLAGRFERELEWVGHSLQGVFARLTLPFGTRTPHSAQIYGIWVNEHADITREFSSDFNFYKHLYAGENLYAGGVNLSFGLAQNARLHFEPYAYYLSNFFGVYGAKFVLDLGFGADALASHSSTNSHSGAKWRSKTIAHSAFLYSNYSRIHAGHEHSDGEHNHNGEDGHGHLDTSNRGDTYFALLEQEFEYRDLVYFGAGFQHIGVRVFEIANIETTSRFEAHEGEGYGVIRPGLMHSGSHTSNAYDAHTNTYYGFVGARFGREKRFALEAMGRDSRSSARAQSAFSLGLRYAFPYGFEIGGIGVFMLEKYADESTLNRSFGKAYMQWRF